MTVPRHVKKIEQGLNQGGGRQSRMPSGILIPDSEIKSSTGGPVTVDTITVSAVTIPNVELKDFKGVFSYASSTAKDVEIVMQLSINSTFHGCGSICWPI